VLEDYDTATMIRRAEEIAPSLAGRIAAQNWAILERRLRDRCERHGKALILVAAEGISQTCPRCDRETAHDLGRTRFNCAHCSYSEDRDIAAATVVLARGQDPEMVRERYGAPESPQDPSQVEARA
jgi:transposase